MSYQLHDQAIELLVCPRCSAPRRHPCVTSSGSRASYPHAARIEPLLVGWRDGYEEGLRTALDTAEREVMRNGSMATAEDAAAAIRRQL